MAEEAKAVARRWFEGVWNERREELIDELMNPDARGHVEGAPEQGREDFRRMRGMFLNAFPDMRMSLEDIVAEGDRAVVRWRFEGTHEGEGLGIAATNRRVSAHGSTWLVVRDGRIVEGWDTWNLGALIQSLQ